MPAETLEDLLLTELKDVYATEHRLLEALNSLSEHTTLEDLSQVFMDHREETERHIERLEEVFEAMGTEPEGEECEGIEGIMGETETFFDEKDPSEQVANWYAMGAAQKAERYEITTYENMLQWAQEAEMDKTIVDAVETNLEDEKSELGKLQSMAEEFDYQQIMSA